MNTPAELGHTSGPTAWALAALIAGNRADDARTVLDGLSTTERDSVLMTLAHALALSSTVLLTAAGRDPSEVPGLLHKLYADMMLIPANDEDDPR